MYVPVTLELPAFAASPAHADGVGLGCQENAVHLGNVGFREMGLHERPCLIACPCLYRDNLGGIYQSYVFRPCLSSRGTIRRNPTGDIKDLCRIAGCSYRSLTMATPLGPVLAYVFSTASTHALGCKAPRIWFAHGKLLALA